MFAAHLNLNRLRYFNRLVIPPSLSPQYSLECIFLPIKATSNEELASYLWLQLVKTIGLEAIRSLNVSILTVYTTGAVFVENGGMDITIFAID